jgi:hypothetical protein
VPTRLKRPLRQLPTYVQRLPSRLVGSNNNNRYQLCVLHTLRGLLHIVVLISLDLSCRNELFVSLCQLYKSLTSVSILYQLDSKTAIHSVALYRA